MTLTVSKIDFYFTYSYKYMHYLEYILDKFWKILFYVNKKI